MAKKLNNKVEFESQDKVIFMPTNKVYDFGYITEGGKAVIYEEGTMNIQDSCVVELNQLRKR
jgi:hypothetical protein